MYGVYDTSLENFSVTSSIPQLREFVHQTPCSMAMQACPRMISLGPQCFLQRIFSIYHLSIRDYYLRRAGYTQVGCARGLVTE